MCRKRFVIQRLLSKELTNRFHLLFIDAKRAWVELVA